MKPNALIVLLVAAAMGLYASMPARAVQAEAGKPAASSAPAMNHAADQQDTANAGVYSPGAGTVILAQLRNSLDVKKLKAGSPVECIVFQDLLYKGKIIVPREAKVIGHVTEATVSSKEKPQSRLGLVFDKIVLKDKRELRFQYPAVVMALAPPIHWKVGTTTRMQDMPVQMHKGTDTGGSAMDALVANPNLAGANMRSTETGAINAGNRGVIGMNGLTLEAVSPNATVIVSAKGDVKLIFETQVVLQVANPPKQ